MQYDYPRSIHYSDFLNFLNFYLMLFFCSGILSRTILYLVIMSSWDLNGLRFVRLLLFSMILTVITNTGQIFCSMSFYWLECVWCFSHDLTRVMVWEEDHRNKVPFSSLKLYSYWECNKTLVCEHNSFQKHACSPKHLCIKANSPIRNNGNSDDSFCNPEIFI